MTRCFTILRRVTGPIGGKWISYTAAQVAIRRAAQMVAVVVCVSVPVGPGTNLPRASAPPVCDCGAPIRSLWPSVDLVPAAAWPAPAVHDVPEPASALVLAVAVLGLWGVRR